MLFPARTWSDSAGSQGMLSSLELNGHPTAETVIGQTLLDCSVCLSVSLASYQRLVTLPFISMYLTGPDLLSAYKLSMVQIGIKLRS
jgi:hypothetical protein